MTDDKSGNDGSGKKGPDEEVDWGSALSDWETKTFVPEVAKDVTTDKPAALSGATVSRPLYRPPQVPPPRPPLTPPRPPTPAPKPVPLVGPEDDEENATVISVIPRELLKRREESPTPSRGPSPSATLRTSRSGGLGQFFARDDRKDPPAAPEDPSAKSATRARGELHEDVVTSAQVVPPAADRSSVGPLRRPSQRAPVPEPAEGEMFDPFAEPRSEQLTIPADSELADLLDAPVVETSSMPTAPPPLLAPDSRQYDPEDETVVGRAEQFLGKARSSLPPPTSRRVTTPPTGPRVTTPPPLPAHSAPREVAADRRWENERPAETWMDDATRMAFHERAGWLEQEARALDEPQAQARGLLACSEILATAGDRGKAAELAREARVLAPGVALAHRQARGLLAPGEEPEKDALDLEIRHAPAGAPRTHAILVAADAAAAMGDDEAAGERLEQAARSSPHDVRAAVGRAARALRDADPTSVAALRFPEGRDLAPVAEAVRTCARLRDVDATEAGAPESPNEVLARARRALDHGDLSGAATLVAQLASVPELARGALWLAAALGAVRADRRAQAAQWLRELVEQGEDQAFRPLAARLLEVGDAAGLAKALDRPGPIALPERLVLATLAELGAAADPYLHPTAAGGMDALACAAAAVGLPAADDPQRAERIWARTHTTAGSPESRGLLELGRLLGASAPVDAIESALQALNGVRSASARGVALETATRAKRASDVSATLESWAAGRGSSEDRAALAMASAIVAEQAGDRARALQGFKAARAADATAEAPLRAIASLEAVDMVAEMNAVADELGEGANGVRAALARLEAVTLGEGVLPEPTQAHLLESAHRAAPGIPVAAFLAERIARRAGDVEEVLQWIRDRRSSASDPTDVALDSVREALLVADREPALAAERLREAQLGRPADVALRELYERLAPEPLDDRAAWREARAAEATGNRSALLFLEAARENERAGDEEGALRCAEAAHQATGAESGSLAQVARERAELRTGRISRLQDDLFAQAKNSEDPRRRREAFERLAELDLVGRRDPASALLWHRSIFEEQPGHKPSLRHLEQHLVGEGRDEELEPILAAVAHALRGTGSAESTAHAELAARLRMRGATGSWDATREMVDVAAAEAEPSLWSLRMLQSHARARGEDEIFLAVTKRLVERASRPMEVATLLVRAAEAALRLGSTEEAKELAERAIAKDPADVVAWNLLVETRVAAADLRGAAEASESLARASLVTERQLGAWYEAGRLWQDEVQDETRALTALESAAALDVAYVDVFDRLSRIYASRKMQPELAQLLQRRMDCVSDPEERRAIEVRRGRVLFEAGDVAGARAAYEAALAERPDDAQALAAFTDLCLAQSDWEVAEQSLIRLARLLPTPDEQRVVYSQLGDLYANHLLNLPRAEVALREVLKCAPDDVETAVKLVEVYKRQNDAPRALELQQELVQKSASPEEKRQRLIELALIHEQTAHENKKAEQVLEAARREAPQDVSLIRALAEFYARHKQTPAFNILLDRTSADARRALTAGRLTPTSFDVLATAFDLRGRADAARVSRAMLATLEGQPVELEGAGVERAFDPQLDDLLAPEVLTPALRSLLSKTGDALDAVAPIDVRLMKAVPVEAEAPIARLVARAAQAVGLGSVSLMSSPKLGAVCIPVGSLPATLVMGETLLGDEGQQRVGAFLVLRALKLVRARASALGRTVPGELGVLVSAWLKSFNPSWAPQGINPSSMTSALARIQAALPKTIDQETATVALEVAGAIGTRQATLGPAALAWANRVALLALGDPNTALDAIASAGSPGAVGVAGPPKMAPRDPKERAAWVARTPEARDLVAFGVTDAFAEARARLGLDAAR